MAVLTVEGVPVTAATVILPLVGRAGAALHFGLSKPIFEDKQKVTMRWFNGWTLTMRVEAQLTSGGEYSLLCTAGLGLDNVVEARYYRNAPISAIARAIITEAGETPGEINAPGILPHYVRRRAPAYEALDRLTHERGLLWNVWDDEKVWIGKVQPKQRGPYRVREVEVEGVISLELALDLKPGNVLLGYLDGTVQSFGVVERVTHFVDGLSNKLETVAEVRRVRTT